MILKENYFLILFEFVINQKCAHLQATMNFMYSNGIKIKMRNGGGEHSSVRTSLHKNTTVISRAYKFFCRQLVIKAN